MGVVVILEDSPGRRRVIEHWAEGLSGRTLQLEARAPDLVAWLEEHLAEAELISLDYHLGGGGPGAGSGFDVALWLSRQQPCCPVIVHTSDSTAAGYLSSVLEEAGWSVNTSMFDQETWPALAESLLGVE